MIEWHASSDGLAVMTDGRGFAYLVAGLLALLAFAYLVGLLVGLSRPAKKARAKRAGAQAKGAPGSPSPL